MEVRDFNRVKRTIQSRINRRCVICGRHIRVIVYEDGSYRGGQYFGEMPELAMRKRPREYDDPVIAEDIWRHSDEYWECPACARK